MIMNKFQKKFCQMIGLRFLGCLSNALADRKQIHHLIRTSFDSHDSEELEAAIFAAEHYAQKSS